MIHRRRPTLALIAALASLVFTAAGQSLPPAGQADPRAEVYNLRSYTHANFTRLVLDIGVLREFVSAESKKDGLLTVDILQARLNPMVPTSVVPTGGDYIGGVRLLQKTATTVRLTAAVNFGRIKRTQVFPLQDPFRIVVDIYPLGPGEALDAPPAKVTQPAEPAAKKPQPATPSAAGYTLARQLGLGVRTIVIDPGHGGIDPGCLDAQGHLEKVTALDISLRLKALLAANGNFDVILTRESDILVPLETRTVLANQKKADLFISIHINAFADTRRRGIETFYLNFSPDPRVNELAARENATTTKTIGEMEAIIKKLVEASRVLESRELAQKIQGNLVQYLSRSYSDVKDLGTRGGPFWVLIGSAMPAVLVEVSHFSNPGEAARLLDAAYRQKAAEGIAEGILAYRKSLGKG
ncbi:MAG: N-acetylmuramoyl-L-alanine amidase [Candidatus Aminicenantes bacterium]|nr:N-acetylmuramoyl-L-alanine amidase [Candidatus Aminicenantes bacterium]